MQFFTSPEDLRGWIRIQESPDLAATKIIDLLDGHNEQDVVDTCRSIFTEKDDKVVDNASKILFGVLAKNNITELKIESSGDNKMKKEAQMMRQDSVYGNMPMRVCPKLPYSVGKRLISTYNCRHYCIDSFTLDDDPQRVYCAEALWRNNIMDKFSREWRQDDGQLVGGYINERFQVTHNNAGNPMELARDERTRKPRPHQYSTERRLSEGRGEETSDLIVANNTKMVKLASIDTSKNDDKIYTVFNDIVEMKEAGLTDEDIIMKVSEHYNMSIVSTARLHNMATKQMERHSNTVYSFTKEAVTIPERSTMISKVDTPVTSLDGQSILLKMETPVVMVSNQPGNQVFQIVDGQDAGKQFKIQNPSDIDRNFGLTEELDIQTAADETGLNENTQNQPSSNEFPIEKK